MKNYILHLRIQRKEVRLIEHDRTTRLSKTKGSKMYTPKSNKHHLKILTNGIADVDAGVGAFHHIHEHFVHALTRSLIVLTQQSQQAQQVHLV